MLKDKLIGATSIPLLKKGMDAYSMRQRAIADNIANVETVGYKRKYVDFESRLDKVLKADKLVGTHPGHIVPKTEVLNEISSELRVDERTSDVNGLNNVDIEKEVSDMTQNAMQYFFVAKISRQYFDLLKSSIKGM